MANLGWNLIQSNYTVPKPEMVEAPKFTFSSNNSLAQQVINRGAQAPLEPMQSTQQIQPIQMSVQNPTPNLFNVNPDPFGFPSTPATKVPVETAKQTVNSGRALQRNKFNVPEEFATLAQKYSKKYGIPVENFYAKAEIESKFNPRATNGAYGGYFANSHKQYGDKVYNADFAFDLAGKSLLENMNYLRKQGIENPTYGHLYLLHQQGKAGAMALMKGGNKLAGEVLNPYYKGFNKFANLGIHGGFQPVFQNLMGGKRGAKDAQRAMSITANDFANTWINHANDLAIKWRNKGV